MIRKTAAFALSLIFATLIVACVSSQPCTQNYFSIAFNDGTGDRIQEVTPAPMSGVHQLHIALVESSQTDLRWERMASTPSRGGSIQYSDAMSPFQFIVDNTKTELRGVGVDRVATLFDSQTLLQGRSYVISYAPTGDISEYVFKLEGGQMYFAKV